VAAEREGSIREGEIRKALADAYCIAAISKEVEQERRSRLGARAAEGITPLEALELYLESKKVGRERTRLLLEHGERLIREAGGGV
jgi:exonuclease SbcD